MVVGSGLIANAFKNISFNKDVIIFASGVSNSLESSDKAFKREEELLLSYFNSGVKLVYFSTFNVFDDSLKDNSYVKHKKNIEYLLSKSENTLIVRIPIILADSKNANTLFNFLRTRVENKQSLQVYINAWRYLCNIDDLVSITKICIDSDMTGVVNVSYPLPIKVISMIEQLEKKYGVNRNKVFVPVGSFYEVYEIFYPLNEKLLSVNSAEDYFNLYLKDI